MIGMAWAFLIGQASLKRALRFFPSRKLVYVLHWVDEAGDQAVEVYGRYSQLKAERGLLTELGITTHTVATEVVR